MNHKLSPSPAAQHRTLYEKLFETHLISESSGNSPLLYIDRHFIHEVTSPQAFSGLKKAGRKLRCPERTFGTMDHNVSTKSRKMEASSPMGRKQMEVLAKHCADFNVTLFDLSHENQGIVHVIGPEQGLTLPGQTIVCGDSHTATHGAFGALAFGIGTSEVEHVMATQCLAQNRSKTLRITVTGTLGGGVTPKDLVLAIIHKIGSDGGTGYVIEFCGEVIKKLSMEGRMTICNMSIEMGAKAGLIAPDEVTFDYLKNRPYAPKGKDWAEAVTYWQQLKTDAGAMFDREVIIDADQIDPQVTWGSNPGQVISIEEPIPSPEDFSKEAQRASCEKALVYMGLKPGQFLTEIPVQKIFIGSCTNSRIEDLRAAASIAKNRKVAKNVTAIVVPGSGPVKRQAESEGLDQIFKTAGFEWREPGCSMCLAMNDDRLEPNERCASTSNRNFEGRQGRRSRTHLLSPAMAAAAAVTGYFTDVRKLGHAPAEETNK